MLIVGLLHARDCFRLDLRIKRDGLRELYNLCGERANLTNSSNPEGKAFNTCAVPSRSYNWEERLPGASLERKQGPQRRVMG